MDLHVCLRPHSHLEIHKTNQLIQTYPNLYSSDLIQIKNPFPTVLCGKWVGPGEKEGGSAFQLCSLFWSHSSIKKQSSADCHIKKGINCELLWTQKGCFIHYKWLWCWYCWWQGDRAIIKCRYHCMCY